MITALTRLKHIFVLYFACDKASSQARPCSKAESLKILIIFAMAPKKAPIDQCYQHFSFQFDSTQRFCDSRNVRIKTLTIYFSRWNRRKFGKATGSFKDALALTFPHIDTVCVLLSFFSAGNFTVLKSLIDELPV